ncbi:transporter substrate-binding domain-containing protein [Massilia sp. 9I]|uniref:transporter substrate-binding domain-containing protein n=1 Tax=Massilia sp. 9I TaxID=2653152 RepID=UPI0012F0B8A4|nr:transporter substrate-binding domain-containing protein [Massilia sp. 9I]VXC44722.1 Putative amino acid ABC transporter periplasmic protein [Massilia sp. 9I]
MAYLSGSINRASSSMRRVLLPVLAACCISIQLPAQAVPSERITLCFERQEVRPWRTLHLDGLNFELLAEVARRTGVSFDYQSMPWKRCLEQLKANQVDGAFSVSFSRERMALGAYPGVAAGAPIPRPTPPSACTWTPMCWCVPAAVGSIGTARRSAIWTEGSASSSATRSDTSCARMASQSTRAASAPTSWRKSSWPDAWPAHQLGGRTTAQLMRGPYASRLEVLPLPLLDQAYYLVLSHDFAARQPQLAARLWDAVEQARISPAYGKHELQAVGSAP